MRLLEADKQFTALKQGLLKIIPEPLFYLLTDATVERRITGSKTVDFELLRRHTKYKTLNENSDLIKNFWSVLSEFKTDDALRFVKFCWGQTRLPPTDQEYIRGQV